MSNAVYCLSANESKANAILTALRGAGFNSEISVLLENNAESRDISLKENAARGAKIGGVIGALLALTIPGIGAALAVGPLLAALGGAAAGGVVGGLAGGSGAFGRLGLPDAIATRMRQGISQGEILIAVHTDNARARERARKIFDDADVEFIHEEAA